jgi:hypothetical protein
MRLDVLGLIVAFGEPSFKRSSAEQDRMPCMIARIGSIGFLQQYLLFLLLE